MTRAASELIEDHAELAALLQSLESALGEGDAVRAHDALDLFWARLAVHIRAEHLQMFEALRAVPAAKLTGRDGTPTAQSLALALEELRADHDVFMVELAEAMKDLRNLLAKPQYMDAEKTFAAVERRLALVKGRLEQHNALEERQVYLWLDELLGASEARAVRAAMHRELVNLPPRFGPRA